MMDMDSWTAGGYGVVGMTSGRRGPGGDTDQLRVSLSTLC